MNTSIDLIKSNINNLTMLWETASASHKSFFSDESFNYCLVKDAEWPNRLWFKEPVTQSNLSLASDKLKTLPINLIVPNWELGGNSCENLFIQNGFEKLFEQEAMVLELNKTFEEGKELKMVKVDDREKAEIWAFVFLYTFGYKIDPETIVKTCHEVEYFIGYKDNLSVGVGVLFGTGVVGGVHSLGVLPTMRKRGFAGQMMAFLINRAINKKIELIVLQASAAGRHMYLKMGFKEQFKIANYRFLADSMES